MLSVGNVRQNSYNTSFGCKGNAKKLVEQLSKKPIISPEQFDKIAMDDPVRIARELNAGKNGFMKRLAGNMRAQFFMLFSRPPKLSHAEKVEHIVYQFYHQHPTILEQTIGLKTLAKQAKHDKCAAEAFQQIQNAVSTQVEMMKKITRK